MTLTLERVFLGIFFALICLKSFAQTTVNGTTSGTWTKANSPYIINGTVTVPAGQTLVIQAGVQIQSTKYLDQLYVNGTLLARGTASDSIRFVGFANPAFNAASTHGGQLYFASNSSNSQLEYVVVDRWGDKDNYGNALELNTSSVSISKSAIRNSERTGIYISPVSISPIIASVSFVNNPRAIEAPASSVSGISGLTNTAIYLRSDATGTSCVIPNPGVGSYYALNGNGFTVSAATTTTIQPGVEIRSLQYSDRVLVNGTLLAKGTASDSIRFIGFANPTYNAASTHGGQLYFSGSSTNSQLEYVVVDRWGDKSTYNQAVEIVSSAGVSLNRCSIRNSEAISISTGSSSVSVINSTIQGSGSVALSIITPSISPVVTSVRFLNNPKPIEAPASSVSGISGLTNTAIYLRSDATGTSCVIPNPGVGSYYALNGSGFTVSAATTTTIQPGVEIRSLQYSDRILVNGTLLAKGTASDSIRFIGVANPTYNAASTHGGQLYFAGSSRNSQLEYVVVDRWGDKDNYGNALELNTSSVSISKSAIRNSERTGIYISPVSISPIIASVSFVNNPRAIEAPASSVSGISSLTNTTIYLRNDATGTSCVIPNPGVGSYYALNGNGFTVSAATTTTIQPGVEIRSLQYSDRILVNGTLLARGTASDSIRFIGFANPGYNAASTHGGQLYFSGSSSNSQLEYVVVDRWGDKSTYNQAVEIVSSAGVSLNRCSIQNSEAIGISTGSSSVSVTNSTIQGSGSVALNIITPSISPVVTSVRFVNNPKDIEAPASSVSAISSLTNTAIYLRNDATGTSCVIPNPGVRSYYALNGNGFTVSAATTTTIQPGVEIRSLQYSDRILVNGTLLAKGTASDSIRFVGVANPGYNINSTHGGQLYFAGSSSNSQLEYVVVDRWGDKDNYGNALELNTSSVSISKSAIRNSERTGVYISPVSISPIIASVSFLNNPRAIEAPASSVSGISGLTNAVIYLRSDATGTSCVIPNPGVRSYYALNGSGFTVSAATTTTIQPGVEIRSLQYSDRIVVNGTLLAKGTASDSIRFVGVANPGYNINSTHGGQLYFNTISSNSQLEYVVVDRWGDKDNLGPAINLNTSSISISKSAIRNSERTGISISPISISPIIASVRFLNNPKAIEAPVSSVSGISAVTNTAIYLRSDATGTSCLIPNPGVGSYYALNGGGFTVSAATTTTIQPGVEIRSLQYSDRIVVNGTLVARGTASDSIRFLGFANPEYNAASTHGGQLYFNTISSNSQLEYVVVDRWGDKDYHGPAIDLNTSSISISKSAIRNSELTGISISRVSISPIIASVRFLNNPKAIEAPVSSVSGISAVTNTAIYLRSDATGTSCLIPNPGVGSYYALNGGGFTVSAATTTTIQPGVEIRSLQYSDRIVVNGTLVARGTASDSIRFLGFANPEYNAASTHGGQLYFNTISSNSQLEYVVVDRWGDKDYHGPAIDLNTSSISISKSAIRNSELTGIRVSGSTFLPSISANRFSANSPDIETYPSTIAGILTNTNAKIQINGGNIAENTTWPFPGPNSYYILSGQTQVNQGYTLTIEAGSVIDFGVQSGELYISGALRAIGTETNPILFTRLQNLSTPADVGRVYLSSTSANSVLNYVTLDKLGSSANNYASLDIATANFSIANITISNAQAVGLQLSNAGNAVISGSNFYGNKTGIYVSGSKPTFNRCNIYGNTNFGINNVSDATADTVNARNSYWGTISGPYHPSLNLGGLGNKVSDKVKFNPWSPQPLNGQIFDIGVSAILAPVTDCNHTAADSVQIRISNYGNVSLTNIPVAYRINTGPVVSATVTTSALLPGKTITYTFAQKVNLSATGTYVISTYSRLPADTIRTNDTLRTTIQHLPGLGVPGNLIPLTNAVDLDIPVTLTWSAVTTATDYDVYRWKAGDAVPTQPIVANLIQISYALSSGDLLYGTQYNWKVVAKRASCRAETPVRTFTTRQLPDLIVESIDRPATAVSETDIVVSWKIKNQGLGSTGNQGWTDIAYLCDQPVLNTGVDNFYINSLANFSALNAGQSYQSNSLTFRVPQGVQGNYYVIIQTNPFHSLQESNSTNNQLVSIPINISLAPPPDLQVTNVVANPLTAFSEDSVLVTYTVKNRGAGPTTTANWTDQILIGQAETANVNTEPVLYSFNRHQVLLVNGEYTVYEKVKLPARISGTYYIHVVTDRFNQVYEYNLEGNNSRASLPLTVIQKPTPNLIVNAISINVDTVANNQPVTLQWTTTNDGAITANPTWQEHIYLSSDAVFNANDRYVGAYSRTVPLNSLSSSSIQQVVNIPPNLTEGAYYFFVKTDAANSIYENPDEDDNVSVASGVIHVVNPDLKPISFSAPATTSSEQTITVQWRVKNDSRVGLYNSSWVDRIYLSTNTTFEPGTDIPLRAVSSNQLLAAGNEYSKQTTVTLPIGISGNYNLLVISDADNNVFEKLETNNIQSTPIAITLTPWPDLQVASIIAPAKDTLGTALTIRYTITNSGTGSIDTKTWNDNIYLSPTSTINEATLLYVGSTSRTRSLANATSFTQTASFTIPTTLTPGQYYVVVKTDVGNTIFEHTGEGNNTSIAAAPLTIMTLPAIDLAVIAGEIISTAVTAGKTVNIQWTTKNNSDAATIVSSWKDAVYLSANPLLDASDVLLTTVTINTPVAAGATYTRTHTVTIPVDVSGTLYILVTTDKDNQQNDNTRGNNTLALTNSSGSGQAVTIIVPPPADLIPVSLLGPAQGTVSQPISVSFAVKNNGTGVTSSGSWTDQLYLSTDLQLGSDILIATFAHTGALTPGESYTVTDQVFLPGNVSGNYVLLLKTDAGNTVYENANEENNLAFASIFINPQQPSDLVVTDILIPNTEQYAGNNSTIHWKLSNMGTNVTNGFLREAIYLSKDTLFDARDILFGTLDQAAFLPSQAAENRTLTKPLTNITVGEYYVIIKTDILNNIVEQNENNNQAISVGRVTVNVKQLPLNVLTADVLPNSLPLYYRVEIPPGLVNETLSVTLKGDSAKNAVNRLFIQKDSVATPNQYVYAATVPFVSNQELIVPDLQAGTYYLLALGTDTSKTVQPVSLFAKIIPFSVTSVDAKEGGNTGLVTLKINGARFTPTTSFNLAKTGTEPIFPYKVQYINQTLAYVTFDLLGKSIGIYDVQAVKPGSATATLPASFTIKQGPSNVFAGNGNGGPGYGTGFVCSITNVGFEEQLETYVLAPASVRISTVTSFLVYYKNESSVDIPVPTRFLISLNENVPVGFSVADLSKNKQDLILECKEEGAPPGILRPGGSGFFKIYTMSNNRTILSIDLVITD